MFSLGSSRHTPVLILDIANASVGGAIVSYNRLDLSPTVKKELRIEISITDQVRADRLTKSVLRAIEEILETFRNDKLHFGSVHAILAAPWYASETKVLSVKKENYFKLEKSMIDNMVSKEISDFKNSLPFSKEEDKRNIRLIESKIIQIRANGYESSNPFEKDVSEADAVLYLSVAPEKFLRSLEDVIKSRTNIKTINLHTFPLVYYSVVRDAFPDKKDFLLADVSGEITEVSIIRDRVLLETSSFPLGRNFIFRRIASSFGLGLSEARSLFVSYASLGESVKTRLDKVLKSAREEWVKSFEKSLTKLSRELYLPEEIFISADEDAAGLFMNWAKEESFSQYILTHNKFKIIPFDFKGPSALFYEDKNLSKDLFVSIDALFVRRVIETA